jgi:dephospho-CoA kinase
LLTITNDEPEATVVIEAALMTETGWSGGGGTLWAVIAEPEVVAQRLVRDRGMDPREVRLRLAAQASNAARRRVATRVIENDATPEDLERAVERAWQEYLESLRDPA